MKKHLFFMMLAAAAVAFAGCNENADNKPDVYEAKDAPPYATSKKVWKIGDLTWSDAIQMPDCDNNIQGQWDYKDPICGRAYSGSNTWYYYNATYVKANSNRLCPHPWRVPTLNDAYALLSRPASNYMIHEWPDARRDCCSRGDLLDAGERFSTWTPSTPTDREYEHFLVLGAFV